jgi:hypothetical protein
MCSVFISLSTVFVLKNAVFCDVAPCGFIIDRRFGVTCRLHLQGLRYFFHPEVGGVTFLQNVGL